MPLHTVRVGSSALPALAFGTGSAAFNKPADQIVSTALDAGFRFLDGAEIYGNEDSMGAGLASFLSSNTASVKRDGVVVLTKVGPGLADIQKTVRQSLDRLKVDQLDVFLIHFPPGGKDGKPSNVEAWREMEKVKDAGLARHIGVSNFYTWHLQELLDSKPKYLPEINQLELHPYLTFHPDYQTTLALNKKHNIVTMVYGALLPITRDALPADGPLTKALDAIVSAKPSRTQSSVLLRYAFQRADNGIIATTTTKDQRAREYLAVLDSDNDKDLALTEAELVALDKAGQQRGFQKFYLPELLERD